MNDLKPLIVKGQHFIQLLNAVRMETLLLIREDLGEMNFTNVDLVRVVDKAISGRRKKQTLEHLETISVEKPDFWDESDE